jgi:hypothetical protein
VKKELLVVTGDGVRNIEDLIKRNPRANIHFKSIKNRHPDLMFYVPGNREKVELISIANHCKGATFLNGNHLINPHLSKVIDNIGKYIEGFYYGRFDIRCISLEDLNEGKNFKILELNGAKSEPAHIYHPGFPIKEAYKVMIYHWNTMFNIAKINSNNGIPYPSFKEGWAVWKKYRYFKKLRNQ